MDVTYLVLIAFIAGLFLGKLFWKILTTILPIYLIWLWYSHGMPDLNGYIEIVKGQATVLFSAIGDIFNHFKGKSA